MKASLFYLPTVGNRREIEAGLAGMRPELYQRMLHDISEQVRLADDLGYDSVSFTEHHFHIEGFEVPNNPVLLDLYFATQTKRIRAWRRPAPRSRSRRAMRWSERSTRLPAHSKSCAAGCRSTGCFATPNKQPRAA